MKSFRHYFELQDIIASCQSGFYRYKSPIDEIIMIELTYSKRHYSGFIYLENKDNISKARKSGEKIDAVSSKVKFLEELKDLLDKYRLKKGIKGKQTKTHKEREFNVNRKELRFVGI